MFIIKFLKKYENNLKEKVCVHEFSTFVGTSGGEIQQCKKCFRFIETRYYE